MAITNNNVQNVKFLRNGNIFTPSIDPVKTARQVALDAMNGQLTANTLADGTAILGRYQETNGEVKTLVGFAYVSGDTKTLTVFDVEGASADVQALREEINAKLGNGIGSGASETVTAQLAALSGNSSTDTSGTTSVEGAKKYTDGKIDELKDSLDYTGVTTGTGVYVTNVTESDGVVSATTATLPSVTDTAVAKSFVTSVSEDKGEISSTKGTITSSGKTIVLADNADGGVNFEVHYDGTTIVQDPTTKELKVASSALVQYVGDEDTIHISEVVGSNKTISSLLTISATTPSEANVKEQYNLVGASGNTIGATIKIYKDSALLSVALLHADTTSNPQVLPTYDKTNGWTDIPETAQTQANQALCYAYEDVSGNTVVAAVPVGSFINEQEFASGVTWDTTANKVRGVVDPSSEKDSNNDSFLTVGADGFKVDGIKDEIDAKIGALDATVGDTTVDSGKHVAVQVVEEDGVITAVTVTEDNIANADDLAELSGKTVTEIASSNSSITVATAATTAADGTVKYDVVTDASKIKMSGFTSTDVLSGITSSSSITEAFKEVDKVITENEETVSASLNDLEASKVENITVNGVAGTFNNKVASVTIDGNDVVLGADYVKPAEGSAITTGDTVDEALGKLEAKVDAAVAGGVTSIVPGNGIAVDATQTTTPTVSAKLTATSDLPSGIAENAIKFDSTSAPGMYIEYLDCGLYA